MFKGIKRIVIKVGSQLLSGNGGINSEFLSKLAFQVSQLVKEGREVIIVSSGAVLSGIKALNLSRKPFSLQEKQALSAIGQPYLMEEYRKSFSRFGLKVAQVLLTAEDLRSKERFVNARNTFEQLLKFKVVPVVNENDTVSVEEIKIGDNDNLSAHVSVLVDADILIMLSITNGIYDKDPNVFEDAKLIPEVRSPAELKKTGIFKTKTSFGTGGMLTKIEAAEKAAKKGIPVVVAGGEVENVVLRILKGERIGTLFIPEKKLRAKTYRILYLLKSKGKVFIDEGAEKAITEGGKSLLAKGVKRVEGTFERGDVVEVCSMDGKVLGKGIARCSSDDLQNFSKTFIHRDELALFEEEA